MEGFWSTSFDPDCQYQNRVIGPTKSPRIEQPFACTTMRLRPNDAARVETDYSIW
jgi:hypothetical protein